MRFLADESCDFGVVTELRKAGHNVKTIVEMDPGISDEEVAEISVKENRILITEDKDFGQLVYTTSQASVGIIFIRFPGIARSLLFSTILELVKNHGNKLTQHFVVVQPGRVRFTGTQLIKPLKGGNRDSQTM